VVLRACAGKVKGVGVYWLVTGLYGGYEEEMEKGLKEFISFYEF